MKKKSYDSSLQYKLKLLLCYKDFLRNKFRPCFNLYEHSFRKHQKKAAGRLYTKLKEAESGGRPIEVAFLLTIPGMWKVDYLFIELQNDPRFHPYVVIYPYSMFKGFSTSEVETTIEKTVAFIKEKGFEYIIPRDSKGKWQNIKKTLSPDIVFFSTPYKDIPPQYYIYNFKNTLTCYIPYGLTLMNTYKANYDLIFHNLVGLYFLETDFNKQMAIEHSRNHGVNVEVCGYLATEVFLRDDYSPVDRWKTQNVAKKKIIWAPHHTIDSTFEMSTFMLHCDDMLALAEKYKDKVQFVFKPHQLLKFKLQQEWGQEKTDAYYNKWASMENTQLEETSYIDLFLTSDAMIHDCGSFTTEYLFTRKPVMYLTHDDKYKERFSPLGLKAFECHYIGDTLEKIDGFIQDVVLNGNDPMKDCRDDFYKSYLYPNDNIMPSKKVINLLTQFIESSSIR